MATNYLHGVEAVDVETGPVPVRVVKSAVIALFGIAPIGPKQELIAVNNAVDAAQFGAQLPGFNIPKALAAIQKQGVGSVLVVNIFDHTTMCTTVTEEEVTIADRKAKTAFCPVGTVPVVTDEDDLILVAGTDYSIDDFGNIVALVAGIADDDILKVTYKKLNAGAITSVLLIGGIDNDGVKTGSALFADAYNKFGYKGKIFICPWYSNVQAVADELIVLADKYKGVCLLDAPNGISPSAAIADRGPAGTIFNTSSKRAGLLYPAFYAPVADPSIADDSDDKQEITPYSMWAAGVMAATDNAEGYWFSFSNHEIKGITGPSRDISWALDDPNTEANALNEAGIITYAAGFGTGTRVWGNRSAAYPVSTHISNFICVTRTADVLNESVVLASMQFADKPLDQARLDTIRETVNGFMRTLIKRGALIDGKNSAGQTTGCYFDPAKNPALQLAAGKAIFDLIFCPPAPMEWTVFNSIIDTSLLSSLK
jgi:phage tail sheath protein FI